MSIFLSILFWHKKLSGQDYQDLSQPISSSVVTRTASLGSVGLLLSVLPLYSLVLQSEYTRVGTVMSMLCFFRNKLSNFFFRDLVLLSLVLSWGWEKKKDTERRHNYSLLSSVFPDLGGCLACTPAQHLSLPSPHSHLLRNSTNTFMEPGIIK